MAHIVDMPRLSDTLQEGVLRAWRKSEGDLVGPGEVLAEPETDKATPDWEAERQGTLLRKLVGEGAVVAVGAPIAIVGDGGEDITALVAEALSRAGAHPQMKRQLSPLSPGATVKPLLLMRKTIARRLVESKTSIPHFYLTTDADVDAALDFRDNVARDHGLRVSMNDLVLKAAALALRRLPEANASFLESAAIVQHARVHIAMAVAVEGGVVTPVLRLEPGQLRHRALRRHHRPAPVGHPGRRAGPQGAGGAARRAGHRPSHVADVVVRPPRGGRRRRRPLAASDRRHARTPGGPRVLRRFVSAPRRGWRPGRPSAHRSTRRPTPG